MNRTCIFCKKEDKCKHKDYFEQARDKLDIIEKDRPQDAMIFLEVYCNDFIKKDGYAHRK